MLSSKNSDCIPVVMFTSADAMVENARRVQARRNAGYHSKPRCSALSLHVLDVAPPSEPLKQSQVPKSPSLKLTPAAIRQVEAAKRRADTHTGGVQKPTLKSLLAYVVAKSGVSENDIISIRRDRSICKARFEFCWLAKNYTTKSFPEIGRFLGGRDHTTIIHSVRRHEANIRNGRA